MHGEKKKARIEGALGNSHSECWVEHVGLPRKLSRGEPSMNSAQAARLQQRCLELADGRVVHRTSWESIGLIDHDPARVSPARWPTKKRRAIGGRLPDPPSRECSLFLSGKSRGE